MHKPLFFLLAISVLFSCNLHTSNTEKLSRRDSTEVLNILKQSNDALSADKSKAAELAKNALAICKGKSRLLEANSYEAITLSQRYYVAQDTMLKTDIEGLNASKQADDSVVLFDAYYNYIYDLVAFNIFDKVDSLLNKCSELFLPLNNNDIKARLLHLQGLYSFKLQSNLTETEKQFNQSLLLAQQQGNNYLAAIDKLWIFQTQTFKGKFDTTARLAFEALRFFEQNNYAEDVSVCEAIIGNAYKNSGNMNKANEFLSRAYSKAVETKNYLTAVNSLTSLVYVYFVDNNLEAIKAAIPLLNKYADTMAAPFITGITRAFEGRYYVWENKYDTAEILFNESEAAAHSINSYKLLTIAYGFKVESYARQNKKEAADSMQALAYLMMQKSVSKELIENSYKTEGDTTVEHLSADAKLEKRLYTDSAFAASKGREALKTLRHDADTIEIRPVISVFDSSISAVYNDQLVGYEIQYKTKQKDDSIRIQKQQAIIATQNIRKQNIIIAAIAVISLLLGIGFWLQYKNRKRTEKDKAKIELLQNEIHHRVKNNLAIIKRFVDVAHQSGNENISLHSLQSRIAAIELLHKNLYQSNAAGEILLQDYLSQLAAGISNVFYDDDIDISINAPVKTDMKTAEKLGLLINELLTNSIKYAFPAKKGKIEIITESVDEKQFALSYIDYGIGYDMKNTAKGYGSKLIKGIAAELGKKYTLTANNGVKFTIII